MTTKKDLIKNSILKVLFTSSNGLYPHSILQKTKIPPSILLINLSELVNNKLIEQKKDKIFITNEGKNLIYFSKYSERAKKPWLKIPSEFEIDSKYRLKYYVPSVSRLDLNFFSNLTKEDQG